MSKAYDVVMFVLYEQDYKTLVKTLKAGEYQKLLGLIERNSDTFTTPDETYVATRISDFAWDIFSREDVRVADTFIHSCRRSYLLIDNEAHVTYDNYSDGDNAFGGFLELEQDIIAPDFNLPEKRGRFLVVHNYTDYPEGTNLAKATANTMIYGPYADISDAKYKFNELANELKSENDFDDEFRLSKKSDGLRLYYPDGTEKDHIQLISLSDKPERYNVYGDDMKRR